MTDKMSQLLSRRLPRGGIPKAPTHSSRLYREFDEEIEEGNGRHITTYMKYDSQDEFGAMGSTSFLGFSCPNLLLVFLNLLFLGTCIIFLSQVLGLSLGLFYFSFIFCTLFWVSL